MVGLMVKVINRGLGKPWSPRFLWLEHDDGATWPGGRRTVVYRANLETRLFMPNTVCNESVVSREAPLLPAPIRAGSFTEQLKLALAPLVDSGQAGGLPGLDYVSEFVGLSRRTIQRALRREGTSYRAVSDELGFAVATRLLEAGRSAQDVSQWLGYGAPAHFSRAFSRWAGYPPSAHRGS